MRVYQCDRCGAIIGSDEEVTKLHFKSHTDDARVGDIYKKRDLCKACAERLLREASGEPVGQPDGMINAKRLIDKIAASDYRITKHGENHDVFGMTASDIGELIREELSEENDDE